MTVDTHLAIVALKSDIQVATVLAAISTTANERHYWQERKASDERAIKLLTEHLPPNPPTA